MVGDECLEPDGFYGVPSSSVVRVASSRDPFPRCRALCGCPVNYPVDERADLNEVEAAELNPACFMYSDAELEEWGACVRRVLARFEGPPAWWFRKYRRGAG
jgi:hypothetical protein